MIIPGEFIQKTIRTFEDKNDIEKIWRKPLAAAFPASHPLVPSLRRMVAPDHFLPNDILTGAKSVISFFVSFEQHIIESNREGEAASEEWAAAYVLTNELIGFINDELEKLLSVHGFRTGKVTATHNFDEKTLMSRWSHRHIAWIAGLGNFGLNNMLITSQGCCGRFGSLVTDAESGELGIPIANSDPRLEKCLHKLKGVCGACRQNCPVDAYSRSGGFNRQRCYEACLKNAEFYKSKKIRGIADVCGKCTVGLPV